MKRFMDEDFLLETETARRLFHEHAEKMPILDFHSHIHPREIAENRSYRSLAEAWLADDHYKWRLMRADGLEERFITGGRTPGRDRFQKFAEMMPKAIGNPMYDWVHLELARYFHSHVPLSGKTADEVWDLAGIALTQPEMRAQAILERSNVKVLCTVDDPTDDLKWHKAIKTSGCKTQVLPTFRADGALTIEDPDWENYMKYDLGQAADVDITTMADVREALHRRLDYFAAQGCRIVDCGVECVRYHEVEEFELDDIVGKYINGKGTPTKMDQERYRGALMLFLGKECSERGWILTIHYGALRNVNTKRRTQLGTAAGFDSISARDSAKGITLLLDALDRLESLPKVILYPANPADNAVIASIVGAFPGDGTRGRVQQGAAWWFNNTRKGIEEQIATLASLGLLGNTIGTVTDSRSPFSFPRHEYYRRILCNYIGRLVENGAYPDDDEMLAQIVDDISYNNAARFLGFEDLVVEEGKKNS